MEIVELRDTDGLRDWELYYEGVQLLRLNREAPLPYRNELLGFKELKLIWRVSPQLGSNRDCIVAVQVHNSELYAFSFSGHRHKIDHETGEIIETTFTK